MHAVSNQIKIMRKQVGLGARQDWSSVWFVLLSINLETSHQRPLTAGWSADVQESGVQLRAAGWGFCFRSVHVIFLSLFVGTPKKQGTEHSNLRFSISAFEMTHLPRRFASTSGIAGGFRAKMIVKAWSVPLRKHI
jgi:hypothetical protein